MDEDGVCDVLDSDRRIPLTMAWYAGGRPEDYPVTMTGPYNGANSGFAVKSVDQLKKRIHNDFISIQFGQDFNFEIEEPGLFKMIFASPVADSPRLEYNTNTVDAFEERQILASNSNYGDQLSDPSDADDWPESTEFSRSDDASIPSISPVMQGTFSMRAHDGTLTEVPFDVANIPNEVRSNELLRIATHGTSATDVNGTAMSKCTNPAGYDFFSNTFDHLPSHCTALTVTPAGMGSMSSMLERTESTANPPNMANTVYLTTDSDRDYYRYTTPMNWSSASAFDFSPFGGEFSKLDNNLDLVSSLGTTAAWLDAQIVYGSNGDIGIGEDALRWHWTNDASAILFPFDKVKNPMLDATTATNNGRIGPRFDSSFPLLNGEQTKSGVTFIRPYLKDGRVYAFSSSRHNWNSLRSLRSDALVLDNSAEYNFINTTYLPSSTYGEGSSGTRVWLNVERNGSNWRRMDNWNSMPYSNWVGNSAPHVSDPNFFHEFWGVDYAQLVRNLNSYPKINTWGSGDGMEAISIGNSYKMVGVQSDGRLFRFDTSPYSGYGGIGAMPYSWDYLGTWGAGDSGMDDQSGYFNMRSWSSRKAQTLMEDAPYRDLDLLETYYFRVYATGNFRTTTTRQRTALAPATFENALHEGIITWGNSGREALTTICSVEWNSMETTVRTASSNTHWMDPEGKSAAGHAGIRTSRTMVESPTWSIGTSGHSPCGMTSGPAQPEKVDSWKELNTADSVKRTSSSKPNYQETQISHHWLLKAPNM